MKKLFLTMMSLMAVAVMSAQGVAFEPEGTTLEQASAKAKAENKLIFLDAYTQWCGPCKMMSRTVFPQEIVGNALNPRFISIKIDMESAYGAPLAKKLQITAYPTFVIFNADAQEIGRFLGGSSAEEFIKRVEEKSKDNSSSSLQQRWQNGDRDPKFLKDYLATLTASYKQDEANEVAEAILAGKSETFAADSTLRNIFMMNISNPFSEAFLYTARNPQALSAQIGERAVEMKIRNVLGSYQRQIINEHDGTATLNQEKFDAFVSLLKNLNRADSEHYRLTALITLAEKQKDYQAYLDRINDYLRTPTLDANDMQLAQWTKPFSAPQVDAKYRNQMKAILQQRLDDIKAGKRQASNMAGNMRLSRPTDELLRMIINALDGKMPNQNTK
ncbi:thioredoxin family protein [Prevotella sp. E2-28]|uniref:thioredoxin family protein n=1 Tax=Prevotella sp. E2-28 TaxID=2913620 RepID=UPI001EDC5A8D|nr:thioredoxin family protein [Prevotella sp. E2-28]UKK53769.1 thioredoxin family protein [Prevotella sp. E2-28]